MSILNKFTAFLFACGSAEDVCEQVSLKSIKSNPNQLEQVFKLKKLEKPCGSHPFASGQHASEEIVDRRQNPKHQTLQTVKKTHQILARQENMKNSIIKTTFIRSVTTLVAMVLLTTMQQSYAEVDANIQNVSFASVHLNELYSIDGNTGKATLLATVPDTIGGISTNGSSAGGINSLAINTDVGVMYFASGESNTNNKAMFTYNMRTNTFSVVETDMMANRGVVDRGRGMGSAGASYGNGRLYFGVENNPAFSSTSHIYSISVSADGLSFTGNASLEVDRNYQWGDFFVDTNTNTLYSGDTTFKWESLDLGVLQSQGDETQISQNSSVSLANLGRI